jgi:hypothetical protein
MLTIYEVADNVEGHIILGLLQSRVIPCYLNGDYLQGAIGEIPVIGHTILQVDDTWSERAQALISAYQDGALSLPDNGETYDI